jgi:flagellar basal body-associated protein FliL
VKIIIVFLIVLAVVAGLLLTLRTSRNTGMPSEDVIKRAQERTRAEDQADKDD